MAPVVFALRRSPKWEVRILATAQHREMLDQVMGMFGLVADLDLDAMRPNQALPDLTSRLMTGMDGCLKEHRPRLVLAQGDTTTVLVSALASFYHRIPFGHVEAGLRTHDLDYPWPEEMNRVVTARLASINFAPTTTARDSLLREGVAAESIQVTGNTVIDALLMVAERSCPLPADVPPDRRMILVTAHRRENFGARMVSICKAVGELARRYPDLHFLFPVHPNPNVRQVVERELSALHQVMLCEPLGYDAFVAAMKRA